MDSEIKAPAPHIEFFSNPLGWVGHFLVDKLDLTM